MDAAAVDGDCPIENGVFIVRRRPNGCFVLKGQSACNLRVEARVSRAEPPSRD